MRDSPSFLQWFIEIIGLLLSVFSVLFAIVTCYSFPHLILGYNYRVPPIVYFIMDYHEHHRLDTLMSAEVGAFVFLGALALTTFIVSKLLNNILERELREARTKERKVANTSALVKILLQFLGLLLVAAFFLYIVITI